jgi:hypothetical protein
MFNRVSNRRADGEPVSELSVNPGKRGTSPPAAAESASLRGRNRLKADASGAFASNKYEAKEA